MNANIVVGVGNIYASEALFLAKIRPQKVSKKLTKKIVKTYQNLSKRFCEEQLKKVGPL